MSFIHISGLQQSFALLVRLLGRPAAVHRHAELLGRGVQEPGVALEDGGLVRTNLQVDLLEELVRHEV